MKLLVLFVILCGILVFVQAERNDCYWHGIDHAADVRGRLALAAQPIQLAKRVTL